MTSENVQLIILDLDGTLYDINDVIRSVYQTQVMFLCSKLNKSENEVVSFLSQNKIFPYVTKDSRSATELFASLGIDKKEWTDYRNEHFKVDIIQKEKAVKNEVIHRLTSTRRTILLSSNTMATIGKILNHLCISKVSKESFLEVVCSDRFPVNQSFNKKEAIKYLSSKYKIPCSSMLSIGDRYQTDIVPMLDLGGKGVLLKSPTFLDKVINDIVSNKLESCQEYEFL